jgi:hypothetical protein
MGCGLIPILSPYYFHQLSPIHCQFGKVIYEKTYKTEVFNEKYLTTKGLITF